METNLETPTDNKQNLKKIFTVLSGIILFLLAGILGYMIGSGNRNPSDYVLFTVFAAFFTVIVSTIPTILERKKKK